MTSARLAWLDRLGVVACVLAAAVLLANRPPSTVPEAVAAPVRAHQTPAEPVGALAISLHLNEPPWLPLATLSRRESLDVAVSLPPTLPARLLHHAGRRLAEGPRGAVLSLATAELGWGLNLLRIEGADPYGHPIDRAFPLIVGDARGADGWVERAISVSLAREGFIDDDALRDDLSSIAEHEVAAALALIPPIEVGPVTAERFRASTTRVLLIPGPRQVTVSVELERVYVDIDIEPVGRIDDLRINRMWLDAVLEIDAGFDGRPRIRLVDVAPHIDLVERTEGAWNWILDHGAWLLEVVGVALSEGPIRDAITGALDDALNRWVSRVTVETVPPLAVRRLDVAYRFNHITIGDNGLTAALDVQLTCGDATSHRDPGRITHPGAPSAPGAVDLPDTSVVRVALRADAVNGVLHALWGCGALDSRVTFAEQQAELPLFVPGEITTEFALPPVLAPTIDGIRVGVGGITAGVAYADASYDVRASGIVPIVLAPIDDGRALRLEFDPAADELDFYTDCLRIDEGPCRDNALFDRLAWLALPFLPPVGATLPLPDLRLPDSSLRVHIDAISVVQESGEIWVDAGYVAE